MTDEERSARIYCMIYYADNLLDTYAYSGVYRAALEESVEAINCRIEALKAGVI